MLMKYFFTTIALLACSASYADTQIPPPASEPGQAVQSNPASVIPSNMATVDSSGKATADNTAGNTADIDALAQTQAVEAATQSDTSSIPETIPIDPAAAVTPVIAPPARTEAPVTTATPASNVLGSNDQSRTAFANMVRNLMPLSPQQIHTLRGMFDQTQQAVAEYPGTPPRPTSSSIIVNMSPGATPPVIRLRAGYVTSLVFLDSTGQPWPVTAYDLGDPKAFNIQPTAPDGKSDTLIVQALAQYKAGNLAVMLKDENTPVMLTLMPGQRAVDYRVDLRIPGMGPNAMATLNGLPAIEDPQLLNFLDGIPPRGAKSLCITGAPAQAWLYQGHLFLRTRVTILSPGWIATMSSPDGTHVFELEKTPIVLASQRGEMVQLAIKGL